MPRAISNTDDVIDSRDVITRIAELEGERDDCNESLPADAKELWVDLNPSDAEELAALLALQEEAEGYAPDWKHGTTLIHDTYFTEYCEEMVKDCGDMPREIPDYIEIDWEKTADNLKVDYNEVDYDGVTYYVR